jgi:hypothetical protein
VKTTSAQFKKIKAKCHGGYNWKIHEWKNISAPKDRETSSRFEPAQHSLNFSRLFGDKT